jgi:hypothetical protein
VFKSFVYKEKKDSRGAIFDKSGVGHVAPTVQPHQVSGGSPAFFFPLRGEKKYHRRSLLLFVITSPSFEIFLFFLKNRLHNWPGDATGGAPSNLPPSIYTVAYERLTFSTPKEKQYRPAAAAACIHPHFNQNLLFL